MVTIPSFFRQTRKATKAEVYASTQAVVVRDVAQLRDIVLAMPGTLPVTAEGRREARNQGRQAKIRCERMLAALEEQSKVYDK